MNNWASRESRALIVFPGWPRTSGDVREEEEKEEEEKEEEEIGKAMVKWKSGIEGQSEWKSIEYIVMQKGVWWVMGMNDGEKSGLKGVVVE